MYEVDVAAWEPGGGFPEEPAVDIGAIFDVFWVGWGAGNVACVREDCVGLGEFEVAVDCCWNGGEGVNVLDEFGILLSALLVGVL